MKFIFLLGACHGRVKDCEQPEPPELIRMPMDGDRHEESGSQLYMWYRLKEVKGNEAYYLPDNCRCKIASISELVQ